MEKNVNANTNTNTNTNTNIENGKEVNTMNKNTAIKVSGIFNVKGIIKSAESNGLTVTDETRKRLSALTAREIGAQLERAKYYFTIKNSAEYLTALGFKTFTEFTDKFDGVADGKSTISEWTSVYTEFIENTEVTKAIALSGKFTLTELVKMLSVKGGAPKTLHGEEFSKEIELFLNANLAYGLKTWGTTKELAEKIKAWNGTVNVNDKPTEKPTEGTDKPTENTDKPTNINYTDYPFDMVKIRNGAMANHLNNVMNTKGAKVEVIIRVYNK